MIIKGTLVTLVFLVFFAVLSVVSNPVVVSSSFLMGLGLVSRLGNWGIAFRLGVLAQATYITPTFLP